MIKTFSKIPFSNSLNNNIITYCLSAFKSKFQLLQGANFANINEMYKGMVAFQQKLSYQQKLKYGKAIDSLQKRINKYQRIQSTKDSQSEKDLNAKYFIFNEPFEVNISQRLFYEHENKQYQPFSLSTIFNKISLDDLYDLTVGSKSMFFKNLDLVWQQILSNPQRNLELYSAVQQRCQYFQDQLALILFQDFSKIIQQSYQSKVLQKASKEKLKSFKGVKSQLQYSKTYKFVLKQNLNSQDNLKASQIAKVLIKYGFGSEKLLMFSSRSLSNQGYKSLSPESLKNHLFILGYFKSTAPNLHQNLFKVFDILQASSSPNSQQRNGEIGPLNSLLFYMLSNKIEIFELYKQIFQALESKTTKTDHSLIINTFDKELFYLMLRLVKIKYGISPLKILNSGIDGKIVEMGALGKQLPIINSNAHQDFESFLIRKKYKYQKNPQNSHLFDLYSLINDVIIKVENKNFICLNITRMMKKTQKINGVGQIIMQNFKAVGEQVKHINPIVLLKCQKRVQKQEYLRSKLKGIKQPELNRERRFDF